MSYDGWIGWEGPQNSSEKKAYQSLLQARVRVTTTPGKRRRRVQKKSSGLSVTLKTTKKKKARPKKTSRRPKESVAQQMIKKLKGDAPEPPPFKQLQVNYSKNEAIVDGKKMSIREAQKLGYIRTDGAVIATGGQQVIHM